MIADGASSRKSEDLVVPDNVFLVILPPYSPELDPAERIWNVLRRDFTANRYFDCLEEAVPKSYVVVLKLNQTGRLSMILLVGHG
jgi:transposase